MITKVFQCPACRLPLATNDEGNLPCSGCSTVFQVTDGIPRFIGKAVDDGFDYRWEKHPIPQPRSDDWFWRRTGWRPRDLNGKTILDVGCGCGRFLSVAARHGAVTIGLDGSLHALLAARKNAPEALLVHADLMHLPLPDASVDAAFSIGVLHHVPNPEEAFKEVVRTVRPGGRVAIWVYPQQVRDELMPAVEMLYEITKACPPATLHEICDRYAVSLRNLYMTHGDKLGSLPLVLQISSSMHDDECVSDTFDWHVPRYRSWHTVDEVRNWFARAGVDVSWVGQAPVAMSGIKR